MEHGQLPPKTPASPPPCRLFCGMPMGAAAKHRPRTPRISLVFQRAENFYTFFIFLR
jgi:hypothetical protein